MIRQRLINWALSRSPDFVIGGKDDPYLLRWWLIPRNPVFNVYVHMFLRSDEDRATHDHPWANCSILLAGEYTEHTIAAGGVHRREILRSGNWKLRLSGRMAHRIELHAGPAWTLFITGPKYRTWGFHCITGWVPWHEFVDFRDSGRVGKGCGQ
jgi:hypothetical protein